ncbi:Lrp/AsnC family transcriptional regulator, partial [Candidatus Woesearchaeota archaeon]|nr:Lrp/AsnC family transcriptional regulator [Candidatus Woesearchaeota archaeon]
MLNKLDLKDKRLLYELDLDSRQSFNELGKKLSLSKSSVIYRINNMQKSGIIK